jgi:hypothetical protein
MTYFKQLTGNKLPKKEVFTIKNKKTGKIHTPKSKNRTKKIQKIIFSHKKLLALLVLFIPLPTTV